MSAPAKCERCFKTVFAAEAIRLDGRTFHKSCFNCEECNNKLTLTTFYQAHQVPAIFCKKCGPVVVPTLDAESMQFRRAKIAQGLANKTHNGQVRGTPARRPASYYREKQAAKRLSAAGNDDPAELPVTAESESVTEAEKHGVHSGDVNNFNHGYHGSGQPIYGNLPNYYEQRGVERADDTFIAAEEAYPLASPTAAREESMFFGNQELPPAGPGERPVSMSVSREEVYDNPADRAQSGLAIPKRPANLGMSMQKREHLERASAIYNNDVAAGLADDPIMNAAALNKLDLGPHLAAMEDKDYGQPCMKCTTCPGFILHRWRKGCQMCGCPRINHRSREVTQRRKKRQEMTGKVGFKHAYAWTPADCDEAMAKSFFASLPSECVPVVGSEGELWRHEQRLLQLPTYDTDPEFSSKPDAGHALALQELDDIRLMECFDIGQVVPCPDFSRPGECSECGCNSEGYHWAYCSKFIEPDAAKRPGAKKTLKAAKALSRAAAANGGVSAEQNADFIHSMYPDQATRSIKEMKLKGKEAPNSAAVDKAPVARQGRGDGFMPAGGQCHGCSQELYIGEPVVGCGRFGDDMVYFHPKCFACSDCGELLVDLRAFVDVGKEELSSASAEKRLFCGRHWNDNRYPRCSACDETIFSKEHVFEFGRAYHIEHFACTVCDTNLTTVETFVPRGRKPYCFPCFGVHFADKCTVCKKPINPSPGFGGKVSVSGKHWHGYCFRCKVCDQDMAGKPAIPRDDGLFCKPCLKDIKKQQKKSKSKKSKNPEDEDYDI